MRFAKVGLFFMLSVLVAVQPARGEEGNWQEVRALYDSGKLEDAFQLLQKSGSPSPDAIHYYNLGTIALRLGRVGQSVAFLEKANQLSAGKDADIAKNLGIARAALSRVLGAERLDPGATLVDLGVERLAAPDLQALFGLASLAILLLGARRYLLSRRQSGKFDPGSALLLACGICLFVLLGMATFFSKVLGAHPAAVALSRQAIRSGPGEQFSELTQIEPGTKVRLTGNSITGSASSTPGAPPVSNLTPMTGSTASPAPSNPQILWHQIRYSGDGIGWVKESDWLFL